MEISVGHIVMEKYILIYNLSSHSYEKTFKKGACVDVYVYVII